MAADDLYGSGFDAREYRDALGCFGTGVALVTTFDDQNAPHGLTINSFTSVSLHPPIILWCIDERSDRFDLFCHTDRFAINVLRQGDRHVSTRFARSADAQFAPEDLADLSSPAPVLKQALMTLQCETRWRQKAGDHVVIFGTVQSYASTSGAGLGYFRGRYTTIEEVG